MNKRIEETWWWKRAMVEELFRRGGSNLVGCEVGVDKGFNARDMLDHLDIKTLYLVDLKIKPLAESMLKPFRDKIKWVVRRSEHVTTNEIPEPLDFVYIDACHDFVSVKRDLDVYWPLVKVGGLMGGHDFLDSDPGCLGVENAVLEFVREHELGGCFFAAATGCNRNKKGYMRPPACSDWWLVKYGGDWAEKKFWFGKGKVANE